MAKQRGIIYSTPMVRANLAGIKTQTRRVVKWKEDMTELAKQIYAANYNEFFPNHVPKSFKCPYGQVGDILWGRETLYYDDHSGDEWCYQAGNDPVMCELTGILERTDKVCIPSIHMPKIAARMWQEITAIRVERLHDISKADAIAEGVDIFWEQGSYLLPIKKTAPVGKVRTQDPVAAYIMLYNMINGTTMQDNPWNWVIEYKAIEKPKEVSHE